MRLERVLQTTGVTIAGLVYLDKNRDNIPNCDEPGIPGIRIDFNDCNGNAITNLQPQWTDVNGEIVFENLANVGQFSWTIDVPDTFDITGVFDSVKPETDPPLSGITITNTPAAGLTTVTRSQCIGPITSGEYVLELGTIPKSNDLTGVPADCSAFNFGFIRSRSKFKRVRSRNGRGRGPG
mmetsp:Transcript_26639/g.40875  ORF Transcript_26639/g.40875 Transcript_26639/m.40875 type:complete len:181 (+) Transcript_26639:188-730(+)|eukprot:CAMPEP_0118682362 /NCGR_PEP_ID=MMETSP0800-20121206/5443_1 /TAXON_ID=210618 ORGANISM="Striatella unipunctata, Strain CCMP2910" /NCGR_SAMPLE_ID=MMETSP0800 /ASSEMBLY_ACC=CAM_ASM_000638 /LENGTH=180 /DNA_ID=CAMNT_0006578743 /DNA_START=108 /DNA_END=650 /DNA_ORIENTATION=+